MTPDIQIAETHVRELPEVLPLIKDYQLFYGITTVTNDQRDRFFREVISEPKNGHMYSARKGDEVVGSTTVYFTRPGALVERVAHLGDQYVVPRQRGLGIGRNLMVVVDNCAEREGIKIVPWLGMNPIKRLSGFMTPQSPLRLRSSSI